jgi:hypothetical protein
MSFIERIRGCNEHNLDAYCPLYIAGETAGWLDKSRVPQVLDMGATFQRVGGAIHLADELATAEDRSRALIPIVDALAGSGDVSVRDEPYAVRQRYSDPPLMIIDRGAVPYFGFRAYGVHMNGYVRGGDGISLWIGRRAADRAVCPGMLDNMVAGGQPANLGLRENLAKECGEEAAIPPGLADQAIAVGAISYCMQTPEGLKPDVMFCYDLELPADFTPENTDGELSDFYLLPVEEVAALVRDTEEFKFNCNLVIIDFLLRHGIIPPEHPDYLDLLKGLRQ